MAGVHIVIDGAAAIPSGAAQDYGMSIVPQNVELGDDRFHSGTDDTEGLLRLLARTQVRPRVTPPPVEDYRLAFDQVLQWGVDVISLHPLASLSSSAGVAREAAGLLDRASALTILELPLIGPALGLLAIRAAQAGIDDMDRAAVSALIERLAPRIGLLVVSPDLDYLQRFGASAFAPELGEAEAWKAKLGTLRHDSTGEVAGGGAGQDGADADATSSAHAILHLTEGRLEIVAVADGIGPALRELATRVLDSVPAESDWHLAAFSAGADAEAAAVATYLDAKRPTEEAWIASCDPLTATMVGPGAFGVAWYRELE
jgi:fatty acid-binding protein DegV